MAASYFAEKASVNFTLPNAIDPSSMKCDIFGARPKIEMSFHNLVLKDVKVTMPDGVEVIIPQLKVKMLKGEMIPVVDEQGREVTFFTVNPVVDGASRDQN